MLNLYLKVRIEFTTEMTLNSKNLNLDLILNVKS